jgi:hypothetical protein
MTSGNHLPRRQRHPRLHLHRRRRDGFVCAVEAPVTTTGTFNIGTGVPDDGHRSRTN